MFRIPGKMNNQKSFNYVRVVLAVIQDMNYSHSSVTLWRFTSENEMVVI